MAKARIRLYFLASQRNKPRQAILSEEAMTSIKVLRAAGLSDAQIVAVLEAEEAERQKEKPPRGVNGSPHGVRGLEDFDRFWLAYPKRRGSNPKMPARVKFGRIVGEGIEAAAIIAGAKAYAESEASNVGTPYIAQAVTWLNQRRWEDYKPTAPTISPEEAERLRARYRERQLAAL